MSNIGVSVNSYQIVSKQSVSQDKQLSQYKPDSETLKKFPIDLDEDDVHFDVNNQRLSTNALSVVNIVEGWESSAIKEKISTIMDKKIFSYDKNLLKTGDAKINYRFNADPEKNTFASVNQSSEYGKGKDFYFVNGINTTHEESKKTASELSRITGQDVKYIYNPTNGFVKDLKEATGERLGQNLDGISDKTAAHFYTTLNKGNGLKIVAHSQGAAITADALKLCEKMLVIEKEKELRKEDPKMSEFMVSFSAKQKVDKIMSGVEVITMGGAASQSEFPGVKLVEILNPKDPVPQIAGSDNLQTVVNRKVISQDVGNVTYAINKNNISSEKSYKMDLTQKVGSGLYNLGKNICQGLGLAVSGKNIIDYHKLSDGKDAYLNQVNVRSLMYNFGRQDFKTK